ncbi:MAG: hypothetical protein JNM56_15150 [Planctomycetia bacterium]|nr:hypothetical protein [Planctomycetia bacterium]
MKKRSYPTDLVIRVQCIGNHFHKLTINTEGQFVLLDHTRQDRERLEIWKEMGGAVYGCYRFLERWRYALAHGCRWSILPSTVLPYWRACREQRQQRQQRSDQRRRDARENYLDLPYYERPGVLAKLLNRLISHRMNLAEREWIRITAHSPYYYELIALNKPPCIVGPTNSCSVGRDWFKTIHQPGLSFCRRGLILSLSDPQHRSGWASVLRPVDVGDGTVELRIDHVTVAPSDWEGGGYLITAPQRPTSRRLVAWPGDV